LVLQDKRVEPGDGVYIGFAEVHIERCIDVFNKFIREDRVPGIRRMNAVE
jgi:hypothetical protein